MNESELHRHIDDIFRSAFELTRHCPELQNLEREFEQCRASLSQPMRVAIVGKIKTGKSTLMNALLGEQMVATGSQELTFNVNWLRYGETPKLMVHFDDGTPPEPRSLDELEDLTRRSEDFRQYLLNIRFIEVFHPNEALKTFHLIDTPGLESFFVDDSRNTLSFLGLEPQSSSNETPSASPFADAILYLFNQSMARSDQAVMEEFHAGVLQWASPINAIGVLTKTDAYWPSVEAPRAAAQAVTERLMSENEVVRNLFYTIYPVCGLLAFGATTLTRDEFKTLMELSSLPEDRMGTLIRHVQRFSKRDYPDIPVPHARRDDVLQRLGQYGVYESCRLIRSGIGDQAKLSEVLLNLSGFPELLECVKSHFGNRAYLIKLHQGLRRIKAVCFREYQHLADTHRRVIEEINGKFEAFESRQIAFQEFEVLRSYYEGNLSFNSEEVKQLLEVTGEYGRSCAERLGMREDSSIKDLIPLAAERQRFWHRRANDILDTDRKTLAAASVLTRSYQRIVFHLNEAKKHLYL